MVVGSGLKKIIEIVAFFVATSIYLLAVIYYITSGFNFNLFEIGILKIIERMITLYCIGFVFFVALRLIPE